MSSENIKFISTFVVLKVESAMTNQIIDAAELNKLKREIEAVTRIVITCHKRADGDAIGSSLALCRVLRLMGKNATVIIPDQLAQSLTFITKGIYYVTFSHSEVTASNIIRNTQLIFALDYNNLSRVDRMQPLVEAAQVPILILLQDGMW